MSVGSGSITAASALLANNPAPAAQASVASIAGGLTGAGGSAIIDVVVNTSGYLVAGTIQPFAGWIRQALGTFQELLTSLTGDSSAILGHAAHLSDAASRVEAQIAQVEGGSRQAGGCWSGQAASAFSITADATIACLGSTAGVLRFASDGHLTLMGQLADCKSGVVTVVSQLGTDLCAAVGRFLAQMGLTVAGGVVYIAASTVAGGVKGAVKGTVKGLVHGGPVGAVRGFFTGGAHGAAESAAESAERVKQALQAAFANFVRWAANHVSTVMDQVYTFVEERVRPMVAVIGQMSGAGVRAHRAASLLRGQGDPGADTDRPADGTYAAVTQGRDAQGRDDEIITLNQAVGDPSAQLPPGYERVTDAELTALGLDRSMLLDKNGFIADVFRTPEGGYVVAFGGTTVGPGGAMPDVYEDAVGGTTVSPQTRQVLAITEALERSGHSDQVAYTGHSLGGRLAGEAALATGSSAITYNAAGVSPATVDYIANRNGVDRETLLQQANDGQVRRYYTGDDPLTAAQERFRGTQERMPDAVGSPIQLSPNAPGDPTVDPFKDMDPYKEGHFLDRVDEAWKDRYTTDGRPK